MPKLLWVTAPLLLALGALLWLAWRRRAPSRLALNVGISLLLLAYVSTTAGLGIFWVANQQLPAFDWHYLFGYTTVLLLVVHLAFNFRVVWQFLRRKALARPAAQAAPRGHAAPPTQPVPTRRPLLGFVGAGGLALAAGAGYLLGLRHGRTELRLVDAGSASASGAMASAGAPGASAPASVTPASTPPSTPSAPRTADPAWAVVEQFHAFSAHSRTGVFRRAASSDWGPAPPPFKRYSGAERVVLPKPRLQPVPASASGARAHAAPAMSLPDLADLGTWLWLCAGISARRAGIVFRTSPSSGALFATELYVLAIDVRGIDRGPWHYDAEAHALNRLPALAGTLPPPGFGPLDLPPGCRALVLASAIFARSGHKYGDRTYRYVTADLGHALENLRIAVRSVGGLSCRLLPRFDDLAIGHSLGLDEKREGVLSVAAIAPTVLDAPAAPDTPRAHPPHKPAWTSPVQEVFAAQGGRLGVTDAMQLATSLRAPPAARASAPVAGTPAPAASTPTHATLRAPAATTTAGAEVVQALPAARELRPDWPQVIARRRSVRRFTAAPVPYPSLADILAVMTQPAPALSDAVRIDLLAAAVEGLAPACWRYEPRGRTLTRRVVHGHALRGRARAAALDQDVIGDAAVVFVLSLDRRTLLTDPLGPARAYRHGFIEAGLIGERLYLAAGALGLAVCAVGAFYDDEAAALMGIDPAREWVVHFAALGVPA